MNNFIIFAENLERLLAAGFRKQRGIEIKELKSQLNVLSRAEMEESLDEIENNYNQQMEKLKGIKKLILLNNISALQQIKEVYEMTMSSNSESARKDASVATLIALCTDESLNASSLTIQQAYLFCNAMISVPLENYGIYDRIIGAPIILDAVIKKTEILDDQLDVIEGVLDYCDGFTFPGMDGEAYARAVADCLGIVLNYNINDNMQDSTSIKKNSGK